MAITKTILPVIISFIIIHQIYTRGLDYIPPKSCYFYPGITEKEIQGLTKSSIHCSETDRCCAAEMYLETPKRSWFRRTKNVWKYNFECSSLCDRSGEFDYSLENTNFAKAIQRRSHSIFRRDYCFINDCNNPVDFLTHFEGDDNILTYSKRKTPTNVQVFRKMVE